MHVCDIAYDAFFEDTRNLVAAGVRADVTHQKAITSSREELSQVSSRSALRESSLASWLKAPFPLAYGLNNGDEVYELLLHAISSDDDAVTRGLPNWDNFASSRHDFAKSLFDMSSPFRPSPPKAPILRSGAFLPVLKIAHKSLLSLVNALSKEDQNSFVMVVLRKSLSVFKINFFPAQKPKSRTAGRPNTKPMFNSWGNLGAKDNLLSRKKAASHLTIPIPPATTAFNNAIANDCNADWTANSLNLKTLKSFLNKMSLPKDFATPTLTGVTYVDDTYHWVRDNYDGTKPLHHLALLIAIIVASSLLPSLFMPSGLKSLFKDANSVDAVRRVFDDMAWLSKGKKGMADRSIFIAMFTTFIIAVYEQDSPLRKNMDSAQRRGLGDVWTAKHC